ncbi:MAG: hypothetical protein FJY77_04040 [Candidatus Altiarchaeales archaeon]|nr:hypothetical protein [Candidatus Altiarchaeales archaeon]
MHVFAVRGTYRSFFFCPALLGIPEGGQKERKGSPRLGFEPKRPFDHRLTETLLPWAFLSFSQGFFFLSKRKKKALAGLRIEPGSATSAFFEELLLSFCDKKAIQHFRKRIVNLI